MQLLQLLTVIEFPFVSRKSNTSIIRLSDCRIVSNVNKVPHPPGIGAPLIIILSSPPLICVDPVFS